MLAFTGEQWKNVQQQEIISQCWCVCETLTSQLNCNGVPLTWSNDGEIQAFLHQLIQNTSIASGQAYKGLDLSWPTQSTVM